MEEQQAGLKAALTPEMRGGVFGTILADGPIRVDDSVAVVD